MMAFCDARDGAEGGGEASVPEQRARFLRVPSRAANIERARHLPDRHSNAKAIS